MDLVPPDLSMNIHIRPVQGGLVFWYTLYPVGALQFITAVPFIASWRCRLSKRTAPPTLLPEGIRRTASN